MFIWIKIGPVKEGDPIITIGLTGSAGHSFSQANFFVSHVNGLPSFVRKFI